jgi:hypothetical protein
MSMNSQSNPAAFAYIGVATVRSAPAPNPIESFPARSRASDVFWIIAMAFPPLMIPQPYATAPRVQSTP